MTVYLDCNATTPIEPEVRDVVLEFMVNEYGNAGSRTHEFGQRAKDAVQNARSQIAKVVNAEPDEVTFTSGATEALNIAILGLRQYAEQMGRKHIVTTQVEHKAALEPIDELEKAGFQITRVPPRRDGAVDSGAICDALRSETVLVAVMHVNNETGVMQPVSEICSALSGHEAFFLVDAAQGFGKELSALTDKRIDLISMSGHKVYAPKGIGALIARKRDFSRPPLTPIMFGGGQERGLRPGTLPVSLIAGLGKAAEISVRDFESRRRRCLELRRDALDFIKALGGEMNGAESNTLPHVINVRFPGLDSETVMVGLKGIAAISNGSACASNTYKPSHVLKAMGQSDETAQQAIRISWCHLTDTPNWREIEAAIRSLM